MAYEARKESCYGCEYFIEDTVAPTQGRCVRKAPTYMDGTVGETLGGPIIELFMFQGISGAENSWCGEFKPAAVTPPELD